MLNAVLFVLIGIEVIRITFADGNVMAAAAAIGATLLARWVTVGLPASLGRRSSGCPPMRAGC